MAKYVVIGGCVRWQSHDDPTESNPHSLAGENVYVHGVLQIKEYGPDSREFRSLSRPIICMYMFGVHQQLIKRDYQTMQISLSRVNELRPTKCQCTFPIIFFSSECILN